MGTRRLKVALIAAVTFGLAACASSQSGTAVVADAAGPEAATSAAGSTASSPDGSPGSSADGSPATSDPTAIETAEPAGPSESPAPAGSAGPAESPTPSESAEPPAATTAPTTSDQPESPATTSTAATSTGGKTEGPHAAGDPVWPEDICELMPGKLVDGLEKQDGNPTLRCMYSGMIDHKFKAFMISRGAFSVDPDDPDGSGDGDGLKPGTVNGRAAFSWLTQEGASATAAFDVADGSAFVTAADQSKSSEQNRAAALALAERVSKALHSGKSVEAPATQPTTSYAKVPEGTRAWPGNVCDLVPADAVEGMAKTPGNETRTCRYKESTDLGFSQILVHREPAVVDQQDPAGYLGTAPKPENFDGRKAFSFLGTGKTPTATVVFDTGPDESISIRLSAFDTDKNIDPEAVRKQAVELATRIAPKLPKP